MSDWLPRARDGIVYMAKTWDTVLTQVLAAWGVPEAEHTELKMLTVLAADALQKTRSSERTTHVTAECKAAFSNLEKKMRYIKKHYFLIPPLTNPDFVLLLLQAPDGIRSPVPAPGGFPEGSVSYPGPGVLELHLRPMAGQPPLDSRGGFGCRVYWGVMPQGGASVEDATGIKRELIKVPAGGDELPHSRWTRRRKERFDFHGDSGKTVYFCVRYENGKGERGPWGPMFHAIIP